ncbi:hypothetical protein [Pseudodonghicola xiamenensis]|uniref:Uncharacterized protein n=1 Tax=Pseudodonghicola xiamenensis TaxID=337702 RepID=A0A8J3HBQ5_9RHOB|nr:hypothetical protein [Pseudodonghicola xiamenensis]GHG99882.1 hypothetical protein GCM10010961_36050 [Pseudodonghicola xiamenensis]
MRKLKFLVVPGALFALAGCLDNDGERALAGAAVGAVAADATNNNVLTGAAIGAAGGALCNDVGLCN